MGLGANPLDGQEDSKDLLPSRLLAAVCPWVSLWASLGFCFSTETQRLKPILYIQGAFPVSQRGGHHWPPGPVILHAHSSTDSPRPAQRL